MAKMADSGGHSLTFEEQEQRLIQAKSTEFTRLKGKIACQYTQLRGVDWLMPRLLYDDNVKQAKTCTPTQLSEQLSHRSMSLKRVLAWGRKKVSLMVFMPDWLVSELPLNESSIKYTLLEIYLWFMAIKCEWNYIVPIIMIIDTQFWTAAFQATQGILACWCTQPKSPSQVKKKFEPVSTQSLWIVKLYFTSDNTLSFGPWEEC